MKTILSVFFVFVSILCFSQSENTMKYDSIQGSPKASLDDISWIAGHWRGEAFGETSEEIWSPPMGGAMMGVYRSTSEKEASFYEILTITEEENTLILRIKHFDKLLNGWEEKDEPVEFTLVKVEKDKVYFDQLTFQRNGPDTISVFVVVGQEKGPQEVGFVYSRFKG